MFRGLVQTDRDFSKHTVYHKEALLFKKRPSSGSCKIQTTDYKLDNSVNNLTVSYI